MDALAAYLHVPVVSGSGLLGRPSAVIAARTRRRSLFLRRLVLLVVPWAAFVIPSLAVMAFTTAPLNLSRLLPRNTALIGGLSAGVLLRERSYLFVVVGMAVLNVAYCVCWAVLDPADPPQLFLAPLRLVVAVAAYFTERGRWFR
jgi:hypothetical protein